MTEESSARETGETNPQTPNPSSISEPAKARPRRRRIPMSVPQRKLEVQEIPGYRLYWFREENVPRALDAYYEFVSHDEVSLNRIAIGGHPGVSGNTDLGTGVSIVADRTEGGQPIRLVLMKLAMEYFKEDQLEIARKNTAKMADIFDNEMVMGPDGQISDAGQLVYVDRDRTEFRPIMNRPVRKAKIGRAARQR